MTGLSETLLIERVRALLPKDNVQQKRMFGGTCFMLNGNMLVHVSKRGLMSRVGKDQEAAALEKPYAAHCRPTGKPMAGFIMVEMDGISTDEELQTWIDMASTYVGALPPKPAKPPKQKPTRRRKVQRP